MSEPAEKLRAKARQARFLARQTFSRSHAVALNSLACLYEDQAADFVRGSFRSCDEQGVPELLGA